jgi:hypothetical protein
MNLELTLTFVLSFSGLTTAVFAATLVDSGEPQFPREDWPWHERDHRSLRTKPTSDEDRPGSESPRQYHHNFPSIRRGTAIAGLGLCLNSCGWG